MLGSTLRTRGGTYWEPIRNMLPRQWELGGRATKFQHPSKVKKLK